MDKLDYTKLKTFYSVKNPVNIIKRQGTDLEETFVNHSYDFVSRT